MNPVARLINATTLELNPSSFVFPTLCANSLIKINTIRGFWRLYLKKEIYTNPENFGKLAAGYALNWGIGEGGLTGTGVRVTAHLALIASRIVDLAHQKEHFVDAWTEWNYAVMGTFSLGQKRKWQSLSAPTSQFFFSTSSSGKFRSLVFRTQLIFFCSLRLIFETFRLAMRFMDAVDAFSFNSYTRNEAMTEVFIHSGKAVNELLENKEALLQSLQKNKQVVEKVVVKMGLGFQVDSLILGVSSLLKATETASPHMQKISKTATNVILDSLHTMSHTLFGWAPPFLLPSDGEERNHETRKNYDDDGSFDSACGSQQGRLSERYYTALV